MSATEVGLALGGGAARGLAHIGVLQELEAAGVAVTHVAGCSFGAIVGAAYVCGTLPMLEEHVRSLGRADLVRYADAAFAGGVLRGDALLDQLRYLTRGLHFEELPVSFAVLATDLETGAPVVLRTGPVADAVRASISVPGLFAPAVLNGRALVDGGLVELVPVSVLREMRPPRLVAVDVSSPYDVWTRAATRARLSVNGMRARWRRLGEAASDRLPGRLAMPRAGGGRPGGRGWGLVRTVLTAFDIAEARLQRRVDDTLADVVIRPDVRRFHGHQFDRAPEIIAAGRVAARQALPLLASPAPASGPVSSPRRIPVAPSTSEGAVAG